MSGVKTLAIYLPQFHRMKENDEWWGDGFTEWTPVRNAEAYYDGHNQPRVPLNDNYYNLLEHETMMWQASLAKKYCVYGFCFYHYYFKAGRMVMEKPAENLLAWKDIPMKFCFSWASAPWVRSWSKFARGAVGGSIASKFERQAHLGSHVLLEQDYGSEEQWEKHFYYLLPYFKDTRYIKIQKKPVFLFHNASEIGCLKEMTDCWRRLASQNNLEGLYLVGTSSDVWKEIPGCDALNAQQPQYFFGDYLRYSDDAKKSVCSRYNTYAEACKWMQIQGYPQDKKVFLGTFAGYDTTPRHGRKGVIVDAATPELFKESFLSVYKKSLARKNELVFINAWNEWAEGNYVEPDTRDGYKKLEAIRQVVCECNAVACARYPSENDLDELYYRVFNNKKAELGRLRLFFRTLNSWMILMENRLDIGHYFMSNKIKTIAIYENGAIAKHLIAQTSGCVDIQYIIDTQQGHGMDGIPFYAPSEQKPPVDAVIVTSVHSVDEIKRHLASEGFRLVISIREVIDACLKHQEAV